MKKNAPYILPALLMAGIGILGYLRISDRYSIWRNSPLNLDLVVVALYLAWIVLETWMVRHESVQEKTVSDRGTGIVYALSQGLTVLSALWCDSLWSGPVPWHILGLGIFIIGILLREWAVRTLGQFYSHIVRTIPGHRIVDTGPYRALRHPAYAGMITAHLGITIFYFNYATLLIFSLLLIPSIVIRILIEEKTLMALDGYAEFSRTRKRIVPFLW